MTVHNFCKIAKKNLTLLFFVVFLGSCTFFKEEKTQFQCSIKVLPKLESYEVSQKDKVLSTVTIEKAYCTIKEDVQKIKYAANIYFSFKKESDEGTSFSKTPFFIAILNAKTKKIYTKNLYEVYHDNQHQPLSTTSKTITGSLTLPQKVTLKDLIFLVGFQK